MRTNVCTRSSGAADSCIPGVFATMGGTTRATQLSIGIVLRENGFVNAMRSTAATAVLPAGLGAKNPIRVFTPPAQGKRQKENLITSWFFSSIAERRGPPLLWIAPPTAH